MLVPVPPLPLVYFGRSPLSSFFLLSFFSLFSVSPRGPSFLFFFRSTTPPPRATLTSFTSFCRRHRRCRRRRLRRLSRRLYHRLRSHFRSCSQVVVAVIIVIVITTSLSIRFFLRVRLLSTSSRYDRMHALINVRTNTQKKSPLSGINRVFLTTCSFSLPPATLSLPLPAQVHFYLPFDSLSFDRISFYTSVSMAPNL